MRIGVSGLLSLALAVAFSPAAQAADVLAPPHWSSTQVRAARSVVAEDSLVFDLKADQTGGGAPPQSTFSTVTVSASFTHIATGAGHSLDDHALCRNLTWSDDKPLMDSVNCYAAPAFRVRELTNRRYLAAMLSSIKTDPGADKAAMAKAFPASPYWAEAELAVQDDETQRLVRTASPSGVEYRLENEVVVRLSGAPVHLTADEAKQVGRYFALHQPLHPQVRRALRVDSDLPNTIEIVTRTGDEAGRLVLTISNVRRAKVDYPLPAGLESSLVGRARKADTPEARGIQQAILAIEGKSAIENPSAEALLDRMEAAAAQKHMVEVNLLFLQFVQQHQPRLKDPDGPALIKRLRPMILPIKADPEALRFMQAGDLAGDSKAPGDREAAARYLAFARELDRVPFGTFRYVTFANLVRGSKDTSKWSPDIFKAMPAPLVQNYWTHIAAYPWASNAYKDAGDTEFAEYNTPAAWLAFDLGRAVDKDWRSGVMKFLSDYEDRLRSGQPDLF